jgi:hypothetical protein
VFSPPNLVATAGSDTEWSEVEGRASLNPISLVSVD